MQRTIKAVVAAGAALSVGLLFSAATPAQALDKTDEAGNAVQVTHTDDVFQPQFSLWPLGDNVANIETFGNSANNGGNGVNGIPWLLGHGAGNVAQVGSGGNVTAPQVALGVDNHTTITTWGNEAINNGNGSSSAFTGGKNVGSVVDGNGNVLQLMFFQGNVIAPQLAVNGDNYAEIYAMGNYAGSNGNGSASEGNGGALALVNGNGNVVQIMFLSNNVIAPQLAVNGSNSTVVHTEGNLAYDNGNGSYASSTQQVPLSSFGLPGVFTITTIATGNGNVTQIAILSNNVWAPQIAIPGPRPGSGTNTSAIDTVTNDAEDNGNDSVTETDNAEGQHQVGNGNVDQTAHDSGAIDNPQVGATVKVEVQPQPKPEPVAKVAADNDKPAAIIQDDPEPKPEPKPEPDPEPEPKDDGPDMATGNKVTPGTTASDNAPKSDDSVVESGNKVEPTVKAGDDAPKDSDPAPAADSEPAS